MSRLKNDSSFDEFISILKEIKYIVTEEQIQKAKNGNHDIFFDIGNTNDEYGVCQRNTAYYYAAAQNNSYALYRVGWMHYKGLGVPQNYEKALDSYLKAANHDGYVDAQYGIGIMYHYGYGVAKNIHTSIEWYTKAANQKYSPAQFMLGWIYENENAVKDLNKAIEWFKFAEANNDGDSARHLKALGYYPQNANNAESSKAPHATNIAYSINSSDDTNSSTTSYYDDDWVQTNATQSNDESDIYVLKEKIMELEDSLRIMKKQSKMEKAKMESEIQQLKKAFDEFKQMFVKNVQDDD